MHQRAIYATVKRTGCIMYKLLKRVQGKEGDIQRGLGTGGSHRTTDAECITYQEDN